MQNFTYWNFSQLYANVYLAKLFHDTPKFNQNISQIFYLQNFLQTENRLHQRIWIISEVTSQNIVLFLEQKHSVIIFHNNVFSTKPWTTSDLTSTFCSGVQTLIKSLKLPWSSIRYWTTVVKNLYCKNLTRPWNWKSNIFSKHFKGQIFIIISCLKVWKWEKYQHMVLGCKKIGKPGKTLFGFLRIFMRVQIPISKPAQKFDQWCS